MCVCSHNYVGSGGGAKKGQGEEEGELLMVGVCVCVRACIACLRVTVCHALHSFEPTPSIAQQTNVYQMF